MLKNDYLITVLRACVRSRGPGRFVVAMALAVAILPLGGCWRSAGGEGTVDISSAKSASKSNPHTAKAASARNKGGIAKAQKTRRR
jgi:hypothetical protein